jgi:hypothetical protein
MKQTIFFAALLTLAAALPHSLEAQNYYPLDLGKTWTYQVTEYATSDTNRTDTKGLLNGTAKREQWGTATVTHTVQKDTLFNGKTYKIIGSSRDGSRQFVRFEGSDFFRFNAETFHEDNFLKSGLTEGNLWIDYANEAQTAGTLYKVVKVHQQLVVKGKAYQNVLEIGEMNGTLEQLVTFIQYKQPFTLTKYYAPNVGLIYQYAPYPFGGTYSDLEMVLQQ